MQGLVKVLLNSLYGVQIRREIDQCFKGKSQHWMETVRWYCISLLEIAKQYLYCKIKKKTMD